MLVGINTRYLLSPTSGIERYLQELLNNLEKNNVDYIPLTPKSNNHKKDPEISKRFEPYLFAIWDRYMDLFGSGENKIDLFHAPSFVAPLFRENIPTVVTVHDLAFLVHPEFFDQKTKLYFNIFLEPSLRNAQRIICVSNSTANDVKHYFPEHAKKIRVVHNGYKNFSNIEPNDNILRKLNISRKEYILSVGHLNPRKNIDLIIKIFPNLKRKFPCLKFVVAGRIPLNYPIPKDLPIIFTGQISDEELSSLYRNTRIFVYPSKYEGFGFPVLEAMSVGALIAASNTSSIPEISELKEDHLFNPLDFDSAFRTISNLLEKNEIELKSDSVLEKYSWEKMRSETIKVYNECV
jgi:glycosyltransferase involved in cell wall biosynthesis